MDCSTFDESKIPDIQYLIRMCKEYYVSCGSAQEEAEQKADQLKTDLLRNISEANQNLCCCCQKRLNKIINI